ncbi:MAG: U32 family peptidase [Butyrivibrio sp.]|nr:U32 family peptidase [Muribaculum sp.]MCM1552869.1 U32 family peptidase [Butyrivibrio sp.]
MNRRVELLAPAGNPDGFYGAIHAGADAVYLGGERFGARAYADNFTSEELLVCIRYAHIWGRRVYLTVNTLVKEAELSELIPYLQPLYEAGLDGVIVQDIGAFALIREHFPEMELHVSTQMTLTGRYGAKLLRQMGAVRIVPARELDLAQIRELKEVSRLQVETFIHGAMCYCYSGQCLFSSILGGRSGNRGRCAQPCRLPYRVEREGHVSREAYSLSLKDMCTVEHVVELISAGIDSFKIEGRMKKPEYAAGVTAIYRRYIDKAYRGEESPVTAEDLAALRTLYIRSELQDGYYYRHNGRDMVTLTSPSYGENDETLLAQIRARYLDKRPRIRLKLQAELHVGQPARLTAIITGSDMPIPLADDMQDASTITVTGDEVSAALNRPIDEDNIRRQLGKTGDTVFCVDEMEIALDGNAFYPLKALNELRRQAIEALENQLILRNGLPVSRQGGDVPKHRAAEKATATTKSMRGQFHVLCRTAQQLGALLELLQRPQAELVLPRRVYLEAELLYRMQKGDELLIWERLKAFRGFEIIVALPPIIRSSDSSFLEEIWTIYLQNKDMLHGFLVRSMDGLGYLREMTGKYGVQPAIYTDAGLYVWNHESLRCLWELCRVDSDDQGDHDGGDGQHSLLKGFCLPYELRAGEQRQLLAGCALPCEKLVYGRIPLMLTANCIVNTMEGCQKDKPNENDVSFLIDRYQKRFPVLRSCRQCMNIIYNSLPLSLHAGLSKWRETADFRIDFTIEDARETTRILQYFLSGAKGDLPYTEYTTGHEKRGVE